MVAIVKDLPIASQERNGRILPYALPVPRSEWSRRPFQIVSLLKMLEKYAEGFYYVGETLARIETAFIGLEITSETPLRDTEQLSMREQLEVARAWCEAVKLEVSTKTFAWAIKLLESPLKRGQIPAICGEIKRTVEREIGSISLLYIPSEKVDYYTRATSRWEQIIARFPGVSNDVEESQKCLALSRYTASVFHSLLVAEGGIIELGTFVGVNDPIANWAAVTKRLKTVLDTGYKDLDPFLQKNREFLEQVHGTVEALKNAWRNKVNHVGQRLALMRGEEFHPDVAEEILLATRAFMRRLVDGLPPKETLESSVMPYGA